MAGRGAIVVPTGFITAKSGVEKKILERIVDDHNVINLSRPIAKICA